VRTVLVVFRKEIREALRDRRALFMALVFPMVLFPLILGVVSRGSPPRGGVAPDWITVALSELPAPVSGFIRSRGDIIIVDDAGIPGGLERGKYHASVSLAHGNERKTAIAVSWDNRRSQSMAAALRLMAMLEEFGRTGSPESSRTGRFSVESRPLLSEGEGAGKMALSLLLPLLLFVFASTSPLAIAADLGAGEKERGTLEPLLALPAGRTGIILGKYLAVSLMGILGLLSFCVGTAAAFLMNPSFFGPGAMVLSMQALPAAIMAGCGLCLVLFFSALELALSLLARSIKEAQLSFVPVLILAMAGGYGAVARDPLNVPAALYHVPLLNLGLVIKQLSLDCVPVKGIVISLGWTAAYGTAFLAAARRFYTGEKILYR
jgi:sodium transport system permease protein